jgi:hypothetical protein
MPIVYKPFGVEINRAPEVLTAPEGEDAPVLEDLPEELTEEIILEQDGVHYINSQALKADTDTEKALDLEFLNLVESVTKPQDPETNAAISSASAD